MNKNKIANMFANTSHVLSFLFITVFDQFRIEPLFRFNSKKESKSDVLKLTVLMCVRMADADDFSSILL